MHTAAIANTLVYDVGDELKYGRNVSQFYSSSILFTSTKRVKMRVWELIHTVRDPRDSMQVLPLITQISLG